MYKSQLPVIEQAMDTATLMFGSHKSRGYCLEMICADFLVGANLALLLDHLQLQLRLPIEKEEELDEFLLEVQDPNSPNYHKWLTPEQFSQEFSLAPEDIRVISEWLRSQGFRINLVGPRLIDFSGTAGQVRNAFKTEIHYLDVKGVRHIANMTRRFQLRWRRQ